MTVTYSLEVSRTKLGGFVKLLLRWRGSIYRLVYREVIIFTILYYAVAIIYRYALPQEDKRTFEEISRYCREFTDLIPITFVMGFYVAVVVGRWWQQYLAIPWPDRCCFQIAAFIQGCDERGRMIRRTLARYLNLQTVLTMQATSTVVRKRFPTVQHLMQAGLMTEEEKIELEGIVAPHGNWWVPSSWFCQLAMQARKEGRIHDDLHLKSLIDDALSLRGSCGLMWSFDWISVPLVYTQVVTLAVYCFFAACLFGRQYLDRVSVDGERSFAVDYYVPVFTFFQFFFYMGWLKVAEQLINPYGEDDDDFELSWIIDRNLQVSYLIVDGLYQKYPKLVRDSFWDDAEPELPYTEGAVNFKTDPFLGSTMTMNIPPKEKGWHINPIPEERQVSDLWVKKDEMDFTSEKDDTELGTATPRSQRGEKTNSKLADLGSFRITPRPSSRSKFLNYLLKGASRSALSSRCASKTSINSISTAAMSRQKSPTPTSIGRTSVNYADSSVMARIESDFTTNWSTTTMNDRQSSYQPPQRQWSISENSTTSIIPACQYQNSVDTTATEQKESLRVPSLSDLPQVENHLQRRVTFDESVAVGSVSDPDVNEHQVLLPEETDSNGTLLSGDESISQGNDSDVPNGSDSEQLTVNSRSLLIQKEE